jgi:hypothetical protein
MAAIQYNMEDSAQATYTAGKLIGRGGEAVIYTVVGDDHYVLKIAVQKSGSIVVNNAAAEEEAKKANLAIEQCYTQNCSFLKNDKTPNIPSWFPYVISENSGDEIPKIIPVNVIVGPSTRTMTVPGLLMHKATHDLAGFQSIKIQDQAAQRGIVNRTAYILAATTSCFRQSNLFHHDIKPGNILYYPSTQITTQRVVLSDYGMFGGETDDHATGTIRYMGFIIDSGENNEPIFYYDDQNALAKLMGDVKTHELGSDSDDQDVPITPVPGIIGDVPITPVPGIMGDYPIGSTLYMYRNSVQRTNFSILYTLYQLMFWFSQEAGKITLIDQIINNKEINADDKQKLFNEINNGKMKAKEKNKLHEIINAIIFNDFGDTYAYAMMSAIRNDMSLHLHTFLAHLKKTHVGRVKNANLIAPGSPGSPGSPKSPKILIPPTSNLKELETFHTNHAALSFGLKGGGKRPVNKGRFKYIRKDAQGNVVGTVYFPKADKKPAARKKKN